jgi:uncharacterized protein (DUF488 family)
VATLYTIGHSTRLLDEFVAVLRAHSIQTLVDIRSLPMSRRLPHFNREALEKTLHEAGIRYVWHKELGGRRKKIRDDSPNAALRNDSFRHYADYMLTQDFQHGTAELIKLAEQSRTAYMCAERVYFAAIVCWFPTGLWPTDTKFSISTEPDRSKAMRLCPKRG